MSMAPFGPEGFDDKLGREFTGINWLT